MEIVHARKMRIYPDDAQKQKINQTLGHCRYIYNKMLERNQKVYKRRGEHLNYYAMQNLLPQMKKYLPWLKEADSQALKYACRQVNASYDRFFKKQGGYPKFHNKHGRQSYTTTNNTVITVVSRRVKLPCLGWIKSSDKRSWDDNLHVCYATISREPDGKYYVSVTYKTEIPDPTFILDRTRFLGLDYKSDGLYMDSNGDPAEMPHYYRKAQELLKRRQRQLAKMKGSRKGEPKSNRFLKTQRRVAKLYRHITNQRKDFLQKRSTEIANRYDGVCIEDLNLRAMANKDFGNGKATNDNGYGMFTAMLSYKLRERGKPLIKVDKWYPSSQLCSCCGHRQKMPLNVRTYRCPECGTIIDRDVNAAVNIRNEGIRILESA